MCSSSGAGTDSRVTSFFAKYIPGEEGVPEPSGIVYNLSVSQIMDKLRVKRINCSRLLPSLLFLRAQQGGKKFLWLSYDSSIIEKQKDLKCSQ